VLGLGATTGTWLREEPAKLTLRELVEHLPGVEPSPELIHRVTELGLITLDSDGSITVDSPAFLDIGSQLVTMGVPSETVLDEYEHLRTLTDDVAGRFTDIFRRYFWDAFEAQGLPADRIADVTQSLEQLGPLAEAVVTVALRHSLQDAAEEFLGDQAARLDLDLPRPGTSPTDPTKLDA
jgi:hypothetical protein